ncbi:tetratricopeptide repeat protein [Desulfovibrio sp. SGI.169]|uniref:tetratricopeptide repeat protein n=1 Tax=Desulfovibrio sp. SGI.169 TaxID=3420561 RepID=UPI003D00C898
MTDLPKLNGPARALVLLLALALAAMLAISLAERFRNPHLTVQVRQTPQAPAGMGDAVGALMQEVAQNPKNMEAMIRLVEALMSVQNWEAAETFAQRAMTLNLNNPQPVYLLGVIRHNQGRHKEAAELLEKVAVMRDSASVRYSLGVLYIHFLNDSRRGVEHLSAGLRDPAASEELKKGIREELEKAPPPHVDEAGATPEPGPRTQTARPATGGKKAKDGGGKAARP